MAIYFDKKEATKTSIMRLRNENNLILKEADERDN